MTDECIAALVEAARDALTTLCNLRTNVMQANQYDNKWDDVADLIKPKIDALRGALAAIDALPPQQPGETVEVRAWVRNNNNDPSNYIVEGAGSWDGQWCQQAPPGARAILIGRVAPPSVPTIPATVLPITKGGEE